MNVVPSAALGPTPRWYETIERVLRGRIDSGALLPGAPISAASLAGSFQVSRAPVDRALERLEADGLIRRNGRRGYLVAASAAVAASGPRFAGQDAPTEEILGSRAAWQRIYGTVEEAVASCSVFGAFHLIETELAKHFRVSRTVAREVLGRLHERGLIRKDQSSHWIAGPLTAQAVRERHELRRLLEPPVLLAGAPGCDRTAMTELHARLAAAEAEAATLPASRIDGLEDAFQEQVVLSTPNAALAAAIRHNQLPLAAGRRSLRRLGLPADAAVVVEHRLVLELLLRSSSAAAAAAFDAHLIASTRRSIAHLKTVAVIPEPAELPPYLVRHHL